MKNAINYYYNLVTYDIHHIGTKYRFTVDGDEYLLCLCERNLEELEEIYKLNIFLLQSQIFVHQIILNNTNEIITYINSEPYVLMKMFINNDKKIKIDDILQFSNLQMYNYFPKLRKNYWRDFWIRKVDYFEYQIRELGTKYPVIKSSFSYFVGMTETAILLLYEFNYQENLVISHRRIINSMTLQDLYNPLNLIIDNKIRDVCEYFKNSFFKKENILNEVKKYLVYSNLTNEELYLFYARMLFPSFYFDIYEEIIIGNKKENELSVIIDRINDYQIFLKDLYWYLKPYINLPDIEWIIKT